MCSKVSKVISKVSGQRERVAAQKKKILLPHYCRSRVAVSTGLSPEIELLLQNIYIYI